MADDNDNKLNENNNASPENQEEKNASEDTGEKAESTDKNGNEKREHSERNDLNIIYDVPVNISAVVGCAKIKVSQLLKLGRGAIIELDKKVGDPVDIYVNNRIVAMGEIVVVDGNIGITMTEIIKMNA